MKTELKYGLIIGALMIGGIYVEYYGGMRGATLQGAPVLSSFIFLIIGVVLGIRAKKQEVENGLSYKEAFLGGVTIAFIAGIILGCYAYLYVKAIDPDFIKRALYTYNQNLEKYASSLSADEKKIRIDSYNNYLSPNSQFISAICTTVIVGALVAIIASFFFRRKPPKSLEGNLLA